MNKLCSKYHGQGYLLFCLSLQNLPERWPHIYVSEPSFQPICTIDHGVRYSLLENKRPQKMIYLDLVLCAAWFSPLRGSSLRCMTKIFTPYDKTLCTGWRSPICSCTVHPQKSPCPGSCTVHPLKFSVPDSCTVCVQKSPGPDSCAVHNKKALGPDSCTVCL